MDLKDFFKGTKQEVPARIRITLDNIADWKTYEKLLKDGKIKADKKGRLRYMHGAPVGDLVLKRLDKNNMPLYQESAEEWFDPESQKAMEFIWP